jgi:hypothetical protein
MINDTQAPLSEHRKRRVLDYGHTVKRAKWWRALSKSGLVSFIAIALWYPLMAAFLLFKLTVRTSSTPGLQPLTTTEDVIADLLLFGPVLVACCFGAYSLKTHGLSRRNIPGAIGFIISAGWISTVLVSSLLGWLHL